MIGHRKGCEDFSGLAYQHVILVCYHLGIFCLITLEPNDVLPEQAVEREKREVGKQWTR